VKPKKPKKPYKNEPEPSRQRWNYYEIYRRYSDEEDYYFVGDGDIIDEKHAELIEKCDCYQVYERIDKALIKKIESSFSKAIDYRIEIQDGYDNAVHLAVFDVVPENEYVDLYRKWEERFEIYERELKIYEENLKKWEEGQKEEKLNKLKKQVAKLESR
jgi:hypothetical protein